MDITVEGKHYEGILKEIHILFVDFCQKLSDDSCLHFSPFMFVLEGALISRYFDWNSETVRLTGDKVEKICTSELNYVPFLYVFGSVGLMLVC